MNRRKFLLRAGASAAATVAAPPAFATLGSGSESAELAISDVAGRAVPLSYTGLSYELAQLSEPDFFSADNHDLVAYFRLLSPQGVLRLGGNSSEFCWFQAEPSTEAPKLRVPAGDLADNWMPHRLFAIPPQAIDNLAGFLAATGWRIVYGINYGNDTAARAASEAAYVADKVGRHLDYFQIGNEPDLYQTATNGTRAPGWGFADYATEWMAFAEAIIARVPSARFGGPDVANASDWIVRFAREVAPKLGSRLVALSGHYYAEGPPNDPRVTTKRLLQGDPGFFESVKLAVETADSHAVAYRMTEGNSCYRGGKPDMSNAFASALWAGDLMLQLASLGCAGVNLHGGESGFLSASVGDHTPGLAATNKAQNRRGGFYTPISSEKNADVYAMPIFYGMLLANQFAGATFLRAELKTVANGTAHAARSPQGTKVAVFNKDAVRPMNLTIHDTLKMGKVTAWRLEALALDSTEGVTLAGESVQPHARWSPRTVETIAVKNGAAHLRVPAASAVLLFIEA
jgi:hypothetical protein